MAERRMVRGERAIAAAKAGAPLFVFNDQRGWVPAGLGALGRAQRSLALSNERGEGTHGISCYGADLNDWTKFETERQKRGEATIDGCWECGVCGQSGTRPGRCGCGERYGIEGEPSLGLDGDGHDREDLR
jgi:hypothetical protein